MTTVQVAIHPSSAVGGRLTSKRLLSVDAFRGLLVAGMVLVTNAGSWDNVYWPLKHADWNGSTPTDMIFPSFLFLVGLSMTFSFASRLRRGETRTRLAGHVLLRSVLLVVVGLLLNGFPFYDMHNLRIPGVLQRIGLCYLLAGFFQLATSRPSRKQGEVRLGTNVAAIVAAIFALLAIYWALLRFVPVPGYGAGRLDAAGNLGAYIDRALMGTNHLWFWGGQMWDPEGLLSTLTATANVLLGILAGEWLRSSRSELRKLWGMAIAGAALMLVGVLLNPVIPINKKIWTDSFMLFSGGFSLLALALLHWLVDLRGWGTRKWEGGLTPALVFGSNAILAFALANMLNPIAGLIRFHDAGGKVVAVPGLVFEAFSRFLNPWNASLAYAVLFVLFNMALLWPLYRRRIFLRL
jgi:predicted acyltransferase